MEQENDSLKVVLDAPLELTMRYGGISLEISKGVPRIVMGIHGSTEYVELHFTKKQARQLSDALDLMATEL